MDVMVFSSALEEIVAPKMPAVAAPGSVQVGGGSGGWTVTEW